jgi:hypothetical protein
LGDRNWAPWRSRDLSSSCSASPRAALLGRDNLDPMILLDEVLEHLSLTEAQRLVAISKRVAALAGRAVLKRFDLHRYPLVVEQHLEAGDAIQVVDRPAEPPLQLRKPDADRTVVGAVDGDVEGAMKRACLTVISTKRRSRA